MKIINYQYCNIVAVTVYTIGNPSVGHETIIQGATHKELAALIAKALDGYTVPNHQVRRLARSRIIVSQREREEGYVHKLDERSMIYTRWEAPELLPVLRNKLVMICGQPVDEESKAPASVKQLGSADPSDVLAKLKKRYS